MNNGNGKMYIKRTKSGGSFGDDLFAVKGSGTSGSKVVVLEAGDFVVVSAMLHKDDYSAESATMAVKFTAQEL